MSKHFSINLYPFCFGAPTYGGGADVCGPSWSCRFDHPKDGSFFHWEYTRVPFTWMGAKRPERKTHERNGRRRHDGTIQRCLCRGRRLLSVRRLFCFKRARRPASVSTERRLAWNPKETRMVSAHPFTGKTRTGTLAIVTPPVQAEPNAECPIPPKSTCLYCVPTR